MTISGMRLCRREQVIHDLRWLRPIAPKLGMFDGALETYARPPASAAECAFARTTECVSADLARRIVPCQFGGNPDCSNCGCIASASFEAIARHRLPGGVRVGQVFKASLLVGTAVARVRRASVKPAMSDAPIRGETLQQPRDTLSRNQFSD